MSPASYLHGRIAMRMAVRLAAFVEAHDLGDVCAAETGFLLHTDPDTVRAPDVAFLSRARLANAPSAATGYFRGAPDVVVEVTSPSDRHTEIHAKVVEWLHAGSAVVIVLDVSQRTATVHRSGAPTEHFECGDCLAVPDVLPAWSVALDDLFSQTGRAR
jgi:Uma2 family endonuclease